MKMFHKCRTMLAVCLTTVGLAHGAIVEKPEVLPDSMLTVTVSDIHGMIDGLGTVVAQAQPGMNGALLKGQVGMMLGDPGLAGIAPGKGLAVVAVDPTNIVVFIEVSEAQSASYAGVLSTKGMQARYTNDVLVAADSAAAIAKGVAILPAVKNIILAKRSPSLRIALQPSSLIEKNNDQIEGGLAMLPMLMGMGMQQTPGMDAGSIQGMIRLVEGELRFFLNMGRQINAIEIVLLPENGSIRISETFSAKAGSRLDTLLKSPRTNEGNPKIQAGLLGSAAVAIDCTLANPAALHSFFAEELSAVIGDMGLKAEETSTLVETMKKWMSLYSGSFSEIVDFGQDPMLNVGYLLEVKDEAAALDLMKSMQADMAPFLKLYEAFGMPMTVSFKESVREHKEIKIHQMGVSIETAAMPEEQKMQMAAMGLTNLVYDIAIFDGKMLYTMGTTRMEELIDRVKDPEFKPEALQARSVYPADGFYYMDLDVAKYLTFAAAMMPADPSNPLPQIAAMLQGSEPVTSAGFREDGAVMWSVNVPGSLIGKIAQAVMMIQMQSMQQGMMME